MTRADGTPDRNPLARRHRQPDQLPATAPWSSSWPRATGAFGAVLRSRQPNGRPRARPARRIPFRPRPARPRAPSRGTSLAWLLSRPPGPETPPHPHPGHDRRARRWPRPGPQQRPRPPRPGQSAALCPRAWRARRWVQAREAPSFPSSARPSRPARRHGRMDPPTPARLPGPAQCPRQRFRQHPPQPRPALGGPLQGRYGPDLAKLGTTADRAARAAELGRKLAGKPLPRAAAQSTGTRAPSSRPHPGRGRPRPPLPSFPELPPGPATQARAPGPHPSHGSDTGTTGMG